MGHLFVVREFVVVSHLKIFPLQLLGPADKPMASPSSSKRQIMPGRINVSKYNVTGLNGQMALARQKLNSIGILL